MLKKYILRYGFMLVMLAHLNASANSPLERNITDVLESDNYLFQFTVINELTNIKNDTYDAYKQYQKNNKMVLTIGRYGNDKLTILDAYEKNKISESMGSLYKDGYSYNFIGHKKKCYDENGLVAIKGVPVTKMKNDSALKMYDSYFGSMFFYHLQPLLPHLNKTIDVNGNSVTSNKCNIFVRDGKENIGGAIVDFIEYRTPENMGIESVGRYYLLNGNFIKYIRLDKEKDFPIESEWQKAYGTGKYGYGGYAILDVKKFIRNVNPNFFQIPKNAKIQEVNMPINFY